MKKNNFSKGLTLIEILVAVGIFSIIVGAISGSFISSINLQKRILAFQELFDTTSYIIEYMTRYLKMAKKNFEKDCLSSPTFYEYPIFGDWCVRFLDPFQNCTDFCLEDKAIKTIYPRWGSQLPNNFNLTSTTTVEVDSLKFKIQTPLVSDPYIVQLQPRLTFSFTIKSKGGEQTIKIQTTVSPRTFNVKPYD